MDFQQIRDIIANSKKKTPVRAFLRHDGELSVEPSEDLLVFPTGAGTTILIGDWREVAEVLRREGARIRYHYVENDRRNSAVPLLDLKGLNARIEPGAVIREGVEIGDNVIVMMGAVLNIGAVIGARTMIDMNVVVGARVLVGEDCHIGAGAVLAGVLEPPSATPVVIEDKVLVGANAVVLEGCRVGAGSVVAAGAVVVNDVPPGVVVAGQPARILKQVDDRTLSKTGLVEELRRLGE